MSIGTQERPINIKDLILDTPERERELPFDPERDITEEDWKKMKNMFDKTRTHNDWDNFSWHAPDMLLLFPDRRHELTLDDRVWEIMKNKLDIHRTYNIWDNFSRCAWSTLLLFPDRRHELTLDDTAWQGMKNKLDTVRTNNDWHSFSLLATDMLLLFPDRRHELTLDDTAWQGMKNKLDECRRTDKDEDWRFFSSHAMGMKILAADRVKVTDHGLEITMRKPRTDFAPPTPPMPEVRRF